MKMCLVISADNERRQNMGEIIEDLGFIRIEAADGVTGLMSAEALSPDIIVFDDNTPGVQGDFVRKIGALRNGKKPFVLACSGNGGVDINVFVHNFLHENLLDQTVRTAMGVV